MPVEQGPIHRLSAQPQATPSAVRSFALEQTVPFWFKPDDHLTPNVDVDFNDPQVILEEVAILRFGYKREIPDHMVYSTDKDPHYRIRNMWITAVANLALLERVRERIRPYPDLREQVGFCLSYIFSKKFKRRPTNALDLEIGDELIEVLARVLFVSEN